MQGTGLEFFTTDELVGELLRRKTFLGVVIHSEEELRGRWGEERMFQVRHNSNLSQDEICRLLGVITEYLQHHGS